MSLDSGHVMAPVGFHKTPPGTGGIGLIGLAWPGSCCNHEIGMDSKISKKFSRSRLCEKSGIALKSSQKIISQ